MNFKTIGILAILLVGLMVVSPVAAYAWQNGNYLTDERANQDTKLYTLNYDRVTGVTSKIRDVPATTDVMQSSGLLYVQMLTHHNLISKEFIIQRVDPTGMPGFTNGARVQKEFMDQFPKLGPETTLPFDHVGGWNDYLSEGTFALTINDGEGGQPERAMVKITKGYRFDVVFNGHATSSATGIKRMSVTANIDGCDVYLNGLKIVKDELIDVPESTKTVCKWGRCRDITVPAYSYWTYKLEGRVTVKSIDTVITNPNNMPLTGHVTAVVAYTVDHNFGRWFDTTPDLEDKTKTFTGTFTSVPQGSTFYDGNIVFADRINDAIIDDEHFPYVESVGIVTDLPYGYYFLN